MIRGLHRLSFLIVATVLLPAVLAACEPEAAAPDATGTAIEAESPGTINELAYTASDFAYSGPDTIPAGQTAISLTSTGQEPHHLSLLKLEEGKTIEDLIQAMSAMQPTDALPSWAVEYGGPNAVAGPVTARATFNLPEGDYAALCFVPSPDGVPHFAKGMISPLTVTAATGAQAVAPEADVTVDMVDFAFAPSSPITAGEHTIRVVVAGTQPHELLVVKLDPGKTAQDFAAAFEAGAPPGPPPGLPLGGVSGMDVGQEGTFSTDFEPGNYAFICFMPDPASGELHYDLGMTSEFSVQ
jgi:plastocyanin